MIEQPLFCTYVSAVEDTAAVVGSHHSELAVHTEVGGGDELGGTAHFVPQRHLLVRNVPQAQLTVERTAQEIAVILQTQECEQ